MIGDFVWSGLRKKIGDLSFLFIYFSCCGLVVVVVVVGVVMAGADDVFWIVRYIIL